MVEHRPLSDFIAYLILSIGVLIVAFPVYLAVIASTHDAVTVVNGQHAADARPANGRELLSHHRAGRLAADPRTGRPHAVQLVRRRDRHRTRQDLISILSAYAVVYFRFPFRKTAFWIIFITLMLPVEVRIYPTYKVVADLKLLDTYTGLILPLIASATGTLLFRQFFMTVGLSYDAERGDRREAVGDEVEHDAADGRPARTRGPRRG